MRRKRQQPPVPPILPNADEVEIAPEKLRDYALNPDHEPDGKHKARVFRSALGIEREDWEYLRDQVKERVRDAEVRSVGRTAWGFEYEVPVWVDGLNGQRKPVVTGWLVSEEGPPRLITAYVEVD